jgi:hypothetical protein
MLVSISSPGALLSVSSLSTSLLNCVSKNCCDLCLLSLVRTALAVAPVEAVLVGDDSFKLTPVLDISPRGRSSKDVDKAFRIFAFRLLLCFGSFRGGRHTGLFSKISSSALVAECSLLDKRLLKEVGVVGSDRSDGNEDVVEAVR